MKALVVYESMYGNTHAIAEAIGRGLARPAEVEIVPVGRLDEVAIGASDLLVVGGPLAGRPPTIRV
jgi:menaquinone-dependent protoporphyrinogen IX oxidase